MANHFTGGTINVTKIDVLMTAVWIQFPVKPLSEGVFVGASLFDVQSVKVVDRPSS